MQVELKTKHTTKLFSEIKKHEMFVIGECLYIRINTIASGGNINSYNLTTQIGAFIHSNTDVSPVKNLTVEY